MKSKRTVVCGCMIGLAVLLSGFGMMCVLWNMLDTPNALRGLFSYKAATIGDGVCLPILTGALYILVVDKKLQPKGKKMCRVLAVIAILAGMAVQASWLISDKTILNWSIPVLHHTQSLQISYEPENATVEDDIIWSSDNKNVAIVDKNGVVTAVNPGTAHITAKIGKVTDTCTVTVFGMAETLTVSNPSLRITKDGGSLQIETTVTPVGARASLTYHVESSDREEDIKGIAKIDENGLLTAIKDGVVKVTVSIPEEENINHVPDVSVYVTISGQSSFNSNYSPKLSETSVTLNKKAVNGEALHIYSTGIGGSVTSVTVNPDSSYRDSFSLAEDEGAYRITFTDVGKEKLKNRTYRIPLVIEYEAKIGDITYTDTCTKTLSVKVKDASPKISTDSIRINRYSSKTEFPLTIRTTEENYTVDGLANVKNDTAFTEYFTYDNETGTLQLDQSFNEIEAYHGKTSVKGYLLITVAGYEQVKVPVTIYVEKKMPSLSVVGGRQNLNQQALVKEKMTSVSLVEKISRKEMAEVGDITAAKLDTTSSYYKKAGTVIESVSVLNGNEISFTWNTDSLKVGTYKIPLLISTDEYVDVPVTVEMAVQRESALPKVTLNTTTLKLNRNYPGETASTGIASISQSNVTLKDFTITESGNADQAVQLIYTDQKLTASIDTSQGMPAGSSYQFICVPQYEQDIVSDQKITVTVKLHEKNASVSVVLNGKIDVLDRENTAVTGTVSKINFVDAFEKVELVAPEKTSSSIYDGSRVFTVSYDDDTNRVTIKAKEEATFIKGKKYAFRLAFTKQNGKDGSTDAESKILYTKDLLIQPTQSYVRFTIDQTPSLYRYVSTANNTQSLNLRANKGEIEAVSVNAKYPLADGVMLITGSDPTDTITSAEGGNGTLRSICYDGVNHYNIRTGSYTCYLNVTMKGALCKEVDGTAVPEPVSCQFKYRIR